MLIILKCQISTRLIGPIITLITADQSTAGISGVEMYVLLHLPWAIVKPVIHKQPACIW